MTTQPRMSTSRVYLMLLTTIASLMNAGCGIGVVNRSASTTTSEAAVVSGHVIGGQQPVSGATVNLYRAGTSGYGTGFTRLAIDTTDANGNYQFAKSPVNGTGNSGTNAVWSCPTDGSDPLIYLVSVGGNTGSPNNNPKAVLATMIGSCSQISASSLINTNEITTAAFTSAFGEWMFPGGGSSPGDEGLGSNGAYCLSGSMCNGGGTTASALGLYNAYLNYSNLVTNLGSPIGSTNYTGTDPSVSGIVVAATPESAKLITMANVLAACINSDGTTPTGSGCAKLFGAAVPPLVASATAYGSVNTSYTFPAAPVDTLEASLYMALNPAGLSSSSDTNDCGTSTSSTAINPTFNVACLYSAISATPPFGGGLTAAPSDWTVGITYQATGACSNGGAFIAAPYKSGVDALGNLFFVDGVATGANIGEIDPTGHPVLCLGNSNTGSGRGLTIDTSGNVWATFNDSASAGVEEIPAGANSLVTWPVSSAPYGITSDGGGNIFVNATTTNGASLYEYSSPGSTTTPSAPSTISNALPSASTAAFDYMAVDHSGNLYLENNAASKLYDLRPMSGNGTAYSIKSYTFNSTSGFVTLTFTTSQTTTVAVGELVTLSGFTNATYASYLNGVSGYVISSGGTTFRIALPSYPTTTSSITDTGTATVSSGYAEGSVATSAGPHALAIDASGDAFVVVGCCSSTNGALEQKFLFSALSTATSSATTSFSGGVNGGRSVVLDGAGNTWIGNAFAAAGNYSATGNFAISEFAQSGTPGSTTFTALSPSGTVPSTCTTTQACPDGGGFIKSSFLEARDISTDASGSVWVLATSTQNGGTAVNENLDGTSIVKVVGASVPVVTPISIGIKNNTVGTKP